MARLQLSVVGADLAKRGKTHGAAAVARGTTYWARLEATAYSPTCDDDTTRPMIAMSSRALVIWAEPATLLFMP